MIHLINLANIDFLHFKIFGLPTVAPEPIARIYPLLDTNEGHNKNLHTYIYIHTYTTGFGIISQ